MFTGCPFCRSDIKGIENIVIDPFKKNNESNKSQSGSSTPSTPANEMMRAPFSGHGSSSVESSTPMAEMLPPRNPKITEPQTRRLVTLFSYFSNPENRFISYFETFTLNLHY